MIMLFLYMLFGALLERAHSPIGHEASLLVLVGIIISYTSFQLGFDDFNHIMTFDANFFFYFILPPIIFAAGYNMKRKMFFKNIKNILILGVFSTILQFVVFTFFTWIVVQMDIFWKFSIETGVYEPFTLSIMEIMLMCSLLVCTDAVAAVSIVKYEEQPTLFSLIFGEGITNDAVCIILFNTVYEYAGPHSTFTSTTPFLVVYGFVTLGFFSVVIGIFFGVLSAYVLKKFRFLTVNPVIETNLVFVFGYLAYSVTELFHYSGIIALLVAGVVMAKYSWYNLSPQAKQVTSIAFQVVAYAVEAFVFGYLGITFFSYISLDWSWQLFIAMLIICILGRFIGTIGVIKLAELFGYKSGIKFKELIFISYAGIIRGAVAFGLVLRIDESVEHRSVIVTTSLALVCFTTIVLGSTVATVQICLFGRPKHGQKIENSEGGHDMNNSHHEEVLHPNVGEEAEVADEQTPVSLGPDGKPVRKVDCLKLMKNMDSNVIKPFLIYNYESVSHKKQREFFEIMMNKGVHLEEAFAGVQIPSDKQQQILDIMKKGSAEQPEVLDSGSHRLSHGTIELAQRRNDSGSSPHDE